MKILIADDDAVTRVLLHSFLTKFGHDVVVAENGRQAWDTFRQEYFPLLISDWMMPGLDGLELCRLIRAAHRPKYTYIMLLTALSGKHRYLEGMNAGADDYVTKPVDLDELIARLRVAERILHLQEEVRQLEELLPTCMYCKKIRDKDNTWMPLDTYIMRRTDVAFSHGICPECYTMHVKPELERMRKGRG